MYFTKYLPKNTAGDQCEMCAHGYHGDAVQAKNCQLCECDTEGSEDGVCDNNSGQCNCLPSVQGHNCDSCHKGHWNLTKGKYTIMRREKVFYTLFSKEERYL